MRQWLPSRARAPIDPEIQREFLLIMLDRAKRSLASNAIGAAILVIACFFFSFGAMLALATAARFATIANSARNCLAVEKALANETADMDESIRRFTIGLGLAGVSWGGLFWVVPVEQFSTVEGALIHAVGIVGVCLLVMVASAVLKVMYVFSGIFTLVAGSSLLHDATEVGYLPFAVFLALMVAVVETGRQMHAGTLETARLLVQNRRMVAALEHANGDLESALSDADRLSRFDPLTSLANRRQFEAHCEHVIETRKAEHRWQVLLLDLDYFKRINDRCGHQAGDAILKEAGAILAEVSEGLPAETLAARLGGEEFVLLVPALGDEGAQGLATLIRDRFRHIMPPADYDRAVTVSIGISSWFSDETISPALGRADKALYEAKEAGRDRVALASHKRAA